MVIEGRREVQIWGQAACGLLHGAWGAPRGRLRAEAGPQVDPRIGLGAKAESPRVGRGLGETIWG